MSPEPSVRGRTDKFSAIENKNYCVEKWSGESLAAHASSAV